MPSLSSELVAWAKNRPGWQQMTMLRLASGDVPTLEDYRTFASELAGGIDYRPDSFTLPPRIDNAIQADPVRLLSLSIGANVNALMPGQTLTFAADGITVVYGDNGSGKSGYARLIKRFVGARVREDVLPDIFSSKTPGPPDAEVVTSVGDVQCGPSEWDDQASEATRIGFFDTSCGTAYLSAESDVTYRPAALFILDGLVQVCDGVRVELDHLLELNAGERHALPTVSADGVAAHFLSGISAETTVQEVNEACRVEVDAEERIAKLLADEAALQASDPMSERRQFLDRAQQHERVLKHLTDLARSLGSAVIADVAEKRRIAAEMRAAASIAADQSFDREPLPGVGTDTWRALWDAARGYSEAEAYVGVEFPNVGAEAKCVLCQQDLDPATRSRLTRFEEFVQDQTEQQARSAEEDLANVVGAAASIDIVPEEVIATIEALRNDNATLAAEARAAIGKFEGVVSHIVEKEPKTSPGDVRSKGAESALKAAAQSLRTRALQVDAQSYVRKLDEMKTERVQLQDRVAMSLGRTTILAEVSRLQRRARLERSKTATGTAPITRKAADLTRDHVTSRIREHFANECREVYLHRVTLKDTGGRKGQLTHQPAFEGQAQNHPMQTVLSEGEQTALGLAGFFTEATFDESKSAIVLDDPVSSLDHTRRARVANRLARMGTGRQVVVFTHDAAFVVDLRRAANEAGANFTERSVQRVGGATPGMCVDTHPWKAKDVKKRLGDLQHDLAQVKRQRPAWNQDQYEEAVSAWAGRLSETWERALSQEVVGRVIDQADMEVRPMQFKRLARITDQDDSEFQNSYHRVSGWVRRHDKDARRNYVAPEITDLEQELELVRAWVKRVRGYA